MTWFEDIVKSIGEWPTWVLITLFIFLLILVILATFQIWRYGVRKSKLPKDSDSKNQSGYLTQSMLSSFKEAHKALQNFFPGFNARYSTPVFLLLGPSGAGKTSIIEKAGLSKKLGDSSITNPINWTIFDRAAVVDVRGDIAFNQANLKSSNKAWHTLLNLFQRFRPRRPVDGLIITIPADIISSRQSSSREEIGELAETLHRRIGEAQTYLGMSLPIYIIITKSDHLAGFSEMTSLLSEDELTEAFGWSSPYTPGSAYSPGWWDEACAAIVEKSQETVTESLTVSGGENDWRARAILFPTSIEQISENLSSFLNTVFRISNFNQSASLRGIYFTGELTDTSSTIRTDVTVGTSVSELTKHSRLGFTTGLLERKIFPEFSLGAPFNLSQLSMNKRVKVAQIFAGSLVALGLAGFVNSWIHLQEGVQTISTSVVAISASDQHLKQASLDGVSKQHLVSIRETVRVMNRLEAMGDTDLRTFTAPSAWFHNLPDRVVGIMNLSYDRFLYREMFRWLTARGSEITNSNLDSKLNYIYFANTKAPVVTASSDSQTTDKSKPNFKIFDKYVTTLATFEQMVTSYGNIQENKDTQALLAVVEYLYDIQLTQQFIDSVTPTLFGGQPKRVIPIDLVEISNSAKSKMETVWSHLLMNWVSRDGIWDDLTELATAVDMDYLSSSVSEADFTRLARIKLLLDRIDSNINSGRYDWLASGEPQVPQELQERINTVKNLKTLGLSSSEKLLSVYAHVHRTSRQRFFDFNIPNFGPVLIKKDGKFALTDELDSLRQKLDNIATDKSKNNAVLSRKLTSKGSTLLNAAPVGYHILWNIDVLQIALDDALRYQRIFDHENTVPSDPNSVDQTVGRLTKHALAARIASQIQAAASIEKTIFSSDVTAVENSLAERSNNFSSAIGPIQELVEIMEKTGSGTVFRSSSDLVISEALKIILTASELLEIAQPYDIGESGFEAWDGKRSPTEQILRIRNVNGLRSYLNFQRERVAFLARSYVSPTFNFLMRQNASKARSALNDLTMWQGIVDDLNAYDAMQPQNPISELEFFFEETMARGNCNTLDTNLLPNTSNGTWFASQTAILKNDMKVRCDNLRLTQLAQGYSDLSKQFNSTLSGKAPFSLGSFYGSPASTTAIQTFFDDFNLFMDAGGGDPILTSNNSENSKKLETFFTRMDRAAVVFKQATDPGAPESPLTWNIEPSFRVNKSFEKKGNQIIKWQLTAGDKTRSQFDSNTRLEWSPGMPIKISFTWALNATTRPVADSKRSDLSINGRTATFSYPKVWSLFSLLNRNQPSITKVSQEAKKDTHVLKFSIPTISNATGKNKTNPIARGDATLFVTLRVFGSKAMGEKRLSVPILPTEAPDYNLLFD